MKLGLILAMFTAATAFADYKPADWNLKARREFAAQRFGIFIHWGLYANYAQGEWYLHKGSNGEKSLNEAAYARMMHGFYPSKFDAKEWVGIFKDAGAKYVTITSRHHDGFSMWPTKADDGYNIANTPFKRDVLGELAAACRDEGLQLNFYYSLIDWHRKDYPTGDLRALVERKPDYASYKKFMMAQITELIDWYKPGNIWFDGEWDHTECKDDPVTGEMILTRTLDWEFDDLYDLIHSKKVLVANNNHLPIRDKEDIQLFERDLPGENADAGFSKNQPVAMGRPIEQCDVIQHKVWGYRITETKFRTAEDVVAMVARAAAKGSNLLMNVGPDGSGQLPEQAVKTLRGVGAWFRKNGESIYGTDGCPIASGKNVVSTRKGNVLYLHFLDPGVREISFKLDGDVAAASYLATGNPLRVTRADDGSAVVRIDRAPGDLFDIVIKITLK